MKHLNSPNQSALSYRMGTHPTFLQRMLARIRTHTLSDGKRPLAALTTRASNDPAIALLDAWAVVEDVLTFYQERIANEGYLRTSTELRSAVELARAIGHQLQPGVAASTALAFTVEAVDTSGIVTLPQGIKVQSVPGQDQVPQTFETVTPLKARPEWNALQPDRSPETIKQSLKRSTSQLKLVGTNTGLQAGDKLLIVDKYKENETDKRRLYVVTAQTVEPNAAQPYTTVTFDKQLAQSPHAYELQVVAFRQQAALFGHNAPQWEAQPDEIKREKSGVKSGFYRLRNGSHQWESIKFQSPNIEFQALATHSRGETHYLFAGTAEEGVFRSTDNGQTWTACNTGLSNLMVNALFSDERHYLFAGTTNGMVYVSTDDGDNWSQLSVGSLVEHIIYADPNKADEWKVVQDGLPKSAIRAFLSYQQDTTRYLLVGTNEGVYRSENNGTMWQPVNRGLPANSTIHALCRYQSNQKASLFAATNDKVYRSTDHGNNWQELSTPSNMSGIRALVIRGHGVLAGTRQALFEAPILDDMSQTSWSGANASLPKDIRALTLSNNNLFAATPFAGKLASDWPGFDIKENDQRLDLDSVYNLLAHSWTVLQHGSHVAPYQIQDVSTIQGHDFTLRSKISRLKLTSGQGLASFGGPNLRTTELLLQSESLALFSETRARITPVEGNRIALDGRIPTLEAGRRIIVSGKRLQSGPTTDNNADQIVSEVAFVLGMQDQEGRSTITLRAPLQNKYDRASVTIQANVVPATHGETVADEVLGSGDGTQINQRFRLKMPPLTYLPAPTESGVRSTLTVRVNGIKWQEVPELNDLHERSQSYLVRHNSQGQPSIIFGDGQKGARLPTGIENVIATYRSGIGLEGEVDANTLVLLQTSPLGVLDVTNPLRASGAAPPDWEPSLWGKLDDTRQKAPLSVLTMDRIVSLSDFEDFTRTFAGIGKVQGKLLWTDQSYLVHLTIADSDGDAIPKGSALYQNLLKAINKHRNPLLQKMQIDSYERLLFKLDATVIVDSRYKKEEVEQAIKKALQETFSFAKRAFAQDVTASEVIAIMQNVAGVVAVDLDYLYLENRSKQLNNLLRAEPARWHEENEKGEAKPAQLLLLKKDGVTLSINP